MKTLIFALLVAAAVAGEWNLPDSLPSCYTGLPFEFQLGVGYTYKSVDIPKWAILNSKKGIITGKHSVAGAWPFHLEAHYGGKKIVKQ